MQRYTEIPSSKTLAESLSLILANDKTAISSNAGTAFPTVDLQEGMTCYRTDEKRLYQLADPVTNNWRCIADLSGDVRFLEGGNGNAIDYSKRNLNEWKNMPTGFYEGTNMLNAPDGDTYWRVLQFRQGNSDGYASQMAFGATNGKVYTRFQRGGTWSQWQELYSGLGGEMVKGLNAEKVADKEPGNKSGNIPLNNAALNQNLNADMLDGYHAGNGAMQIPINNAELNTDLNADKLDGYHAGNDTGMIPISNGKVNRGLNAEMLGGFKSTDFVRVDSTGSVDTNFEYLRVNNLDVSNLGYSKNFGSSSLAERTSNGDGGWDSESSDGRGNTYTVYWNFKTNRAIGAGTYSLNEIITRLVSCAHTHSVHKRTYHHNCVCDCDTDSDTDTDGGSM